MISTFSWAILVSACITIALTFNLNKGKSFAKTLYFVFKPLTSFLILTLAYLIMPEGTAKNWILLALVFCLIGDIALMFEGDMPFIAGLLAFLIGHALFIAVFLEWQPVWILPAWWPVMAIYALVMLVWLLPRTGKLAPAVLVYMAIIFTMAFAAANVSPTIGWQGKPLLMLGALLFVLSDSILAIDRFIKPLSLGHALTLATYYSALWCIVVGGAA
ncbi:MAG TPA: lysoplasmalogenase [Burkholderiaceae bacterium]|nr:lysoplasmalogenase [Burkholderiaceae bacterium]